MDCRGCGARVTSEVCPFCGHDSAFERLKRAEWGIGFFWKSIFLLGLGGGLLFLMSLYSAR